MLGFTYRLDDLRLQNKYLISLRAALSEQGTTQSPLFTRSAREGGYAPIISLIAKHLLDVTDEKYCHLGFLNDTLHRLQKLRGEFVSVKAEKEMF